MLYTFFLLFKSVAITKYCNENIVSKELAFPSVHYREA